MTQKVTMKLASRRQKEQFSRNDPLNHWH